MAALFQCFRRKQNKNCEEENEEKCKCKKVNQILQCPHCKSTLVGYWERKGTDGGDGGTCSKIGINASCMDSNDSSLNGDSSSSDGHSPTTQPPASNANGNTNTGFYMTDYTPGNIPGMSYMPVSKNNPNYNMNHRRRGKAVIFNFAKWNNTHIPPMDLPPRLGSEKDKLDLSECLKSLSFDVVCYDNLKRQVYDKVIDDIRREDHSDADCIVIAIMTHGEKNSIYLSDGSLIPVNSVWEEFEANACPSLAGKPKIFIIQACRGKRFDSGTRLITGGGQAAPVQNDVTDSGTFSYVIPNAADIIVAFSCPLGHYSWRHPERGSWFIQSFCKVFNEHKYDMELQTMLTSVAREVAVNYESNTVHFNSDKKKQVPSTSSTLIRNVFFSPKLEEGSQNFQTMDQLNGNVSNSGAHISLEQVQVALANVQSAVAENIQVFQENASTSDTIPLVSVSDGGQSQSDSNGNTTTAELTSTSSDLINIQTQFNENRPDVPSLP